MTGVPPGSHHPDNAVNEATATRGNEFHEQPHTERNLPLH